MNKHLVLEDIWYLLKQGEDSYFDFKKMHQVTNPKKEKDEIIKDVLSLANSSYLEDTKRYLIYGITDKERKWSLKISEKDTHIFPKSEDIQNTLRDKNINRHIILENYIIENEDKYVYILQIDIYKHEYQPFFVNDGILHTRNQDKNAKILDYQLEEMYRRRFGIDKIPLERFLEYIEDKTKWESITTAIDSKNKDISPYFYFFYYRDFPEFTIATYSTNDTFEGESWQKFPDPKAHRIVVLLKYHTTIIRELVLLIVDGARLIMPVPQRPPEESPNINYKRYSLKKSSLEFKIAEIINYESSYYQNYDINSFNNNYLVTIP